MRYVPIQAVKDDSILKKTIYGLNGEVLLRAGVKLNSTYIKKLKQLGLNGVYIHDEISEGIDVQSTISESLKNQAVVNMKKIFFIADNPGRNKKKIQETYKQMSETIYSFIDELSNNKNLMINMMDLKVFDDYTFYHSVNVALLSTIIGISLRFTNKNVHDLAMAAIMHDIGKVFIPLEILNKKGELSDNEWRLIKAHPRTGYNYLRDKYPIPHICYQGVLHHHERWDGTGYPLELEKQQISLFGRIIAIADVYDALISDRPYRKGFSPLEALEYILAGGDSLFDMNLVREFSKKIQPYPVGTLVHLSNGFEAIVMENKEGRGTRPIVRVFKDGDKDVKPFLLDLWKPQKASITIVEEPIKYN